MDEINYVINNTTVNVSIPTKNDAKYLLLVTTTNSSSVTNVGELIIDGAKIDEVVKNEFKQVSSESTKFCRFYTAKITATSDVLIVTHNTSPYTGGRAIRATLFSL